MGICEGYAKVNCHFVTGFMLNEMYMTARLLVSFLFTAKLVLRLASSQGMSVDLE